MEQKTGWKTSEFWVTVCTMAGALINQSGAFKFQIPLDTMQDICTTAIAYVGSRSVLKTALAYAKAKIAAANVQPAQNSTINK